MGAGATASSTSIPVFGHFEADTDRSFWSAVRCRCLVFILFGHALHLPHINPVGNLRDVIEADASVCHLRRVFCPDKIGYGKVPADSDHTGNIESSCAVMILFRQGSPILVGVEPDIEPRGIGKLSGKDSLNGF